MNRAKYRTAPDSIKLKTTQDFVASFLYSVESERLSKVSIQQVEIKVCTDNELPGASETCKLVQMTKYTGNIFKGVT